MTGPAPDKSTTARTYAAKRTRAMRKPKDPEGTKENILAAALQEFAAHGLKGASMDAIAQRTQTARGMINYYFGNKEDLYIQVLEYVYRSNRAAEQTLQLDDMPPDRALRTLVEFTFDYYQRNPALVQLITLENQLQGEHIRRSRLIATLNRALIERIDRLLARGKQQKTFRPHIRPVDVHMMISALVFFHNANKHTFGTAFEIDLQGPAALQHQRAAITDAVLRYVCEIT